MGKIQHADIGNVLSKTEFEADTTHLIGGVASLQVVRSATLVVAASDASAQSKAQADYACDGTADEVQIQAAIDALPSGGGRVVLSEGTFNLASYILPSANVEIVGQGPATVLKLLAQVRVIDLNAAKVIIRNLTVDANSLGPTGNDAVVFIRTGATDAIVTRCTIKNADGNGQWALWIQGSRAQVIHNDFIDNDLHVRLHASATDGQDALIAYNTIRNPNLTSSYGGIVVSAGSASQFTNRGRIIGNVISDIGASAASSSERGTAGTWGNAILISRATEMLIANNDAGRNGAWSGLLVGAYSARNRIVGNTLYKGDYSTAAGWNEETSNEDNLWSENVLLGTFNCGTNGGTRLVFTNNALNGEGTDIGAGYVIDKDSQCNNSIFSNNYIYNWTATYAFFDYDGDSNSYIGNTIETLTGGGIGINRTGGTGDTPDLVITDNRISVSGTSLAVLDAVTTSGAIIRNNHGYVTENSGTATITSGTTSKVVAHGLGDTPTVINIAFREQGTNDFGRWWVDTIGATNFTLNVSADPGASNLDFQWEALVR